MRHRARRYLRLKPQVLERRNRVRAKRAGRWQANRAGRHGKPAGEPIQGYHHAGGSRAPKKIASDVNLGVPLLYAAEAADQEHFHET